MCLVCALKAVADGSPLTPEQSTMVIEALLSAVSYGEVLGEAVKSLTGSPEAAGRAITEKVMDIAGDHAVRLMTSYLHTHAVLDGAGEALGAELTALIRARRRLHEATGTVAGTVH